MFQMYVTQCMNMLHSASQRPSDPFLGSYVVQACVYMLLIWVHINLEKLIFHLTTLPKKANRNQYIIKDTINFLKTEVLHFQIKSALLVPTQRMKTHIKAHFECISEQWIKTRSIQGGKIGYI